MNTPEDDGSLEVREEQRRRVLRALRIYFAQRRWPRVVVSAILALTGGVGFLTSYALLNLGLTAMWLRYPLAVLAAWAAFLLFIRCWAELERRYFRPDEDLHAMLQGQDPAEVRTRLRDRDWSVLDWLNVTPDIGGDGEGCIVGLVLGLLALIAVGITGAFLIIAGAPLLIAEVFLDAILVAALSRKLRGLDQRWWLAGAVSQTVRPVLTTAAAMALGGFLIQVAEPDAKSLGEAWRSFRKQDSPAKPPELR